jgi:hypothetical protein
MAKVIGSTKAGESLTDRGRTRQARCLQGGHRVGQMVSQLGADFGADLGRQAKGSIDCIEKGQRLWRERIGAPGQDRRTVSIEAALR